MCAGSFFISAKTALLFLLYKVLVVCRGEYSEDQNDYRADYRYRVQQAGVLKE